jgi:hypothetical protein
MGFDIHNPNHVLGAALMVIGVIDAVMAKIFRGMLTKKNPAASMKGVKFAEKILFIFAVFSLAGGICVYHYEPLKATLHYKNDDTSRH